MKALVTGASSGIGRDIARVLAARGCDLVLTARREERLRALASELSMVRVTILPADLSSREGCQALYRAAQGENIDILVNNAGLGLFGPFDETDLEADESGPSGPASGAGPPPGTDLLARPAEEKRHMRAPRMQACTAGRCRPTAK